MGKNKVGQRAHCMVVRARNRENLLSIHSKMAKNLFWSQLMSPVVVLILPMSPWLSTTIWQRALKIIHIVPVVLVNLVSLSLSSLMAILQHFMILDRDLSKVLYRLAHQNLIVILMLNISRVRLCKRRNVKKPFILNDTALLVINYGFRLGSIFLKK